MCSVRVSNGNTASYSKKKKNKQTKKTKKKTPRVWKPNKVPTIVEEGEKALERQALSEIAVFSSGYDTKQFNRLHLNA